ncbi:MAG: tyrosine-type recombinase/integrase [Anaerolineae bacterium]|nr:MAG: tyrosine-type recombinase/integrase [Anaerolineae bacterium]
MSSLTIAEAVQEFLYDVGSKKQRRTQITYQTALNHFQAFLEANNLPSHRSAGKLTVRHGMDFAPWLVNSHFGHGQVKPTTLRTYLTAVQRFYRFLLLHDYTSLSYVDLERLREEYSEYGRLKRRLPPHVDDEVIEAIIAAARRVPPAEGDTPATRRQELRRLRDIALVETLRSTGARVGELSNLRRGDLEYSLHRARVRAESTKGVSERYIYFDGQAWSSLTAYLSARADGGGGRALSEYPVFARHSRNAGQRVLPLSTYSIQKMVRRLAQAAGRLDAHLTPHTFRHWFATRMQRATGNLAVTQDALGHRSPETTRIYARVEDKEVQQAHHRAFEDA